MKERHFSAHFRRNLPLAIRFSTGLGLLAAGTTAHAVEYYKANNTSNLNQSVSWENLEGVPFVDPAKPVNGTGSVDILIWDARVTAANTVEMGGDIGVNTIRIGATGGLVPGAGPVAINSTSSNRTFTFTANGGVDMSAATQDLTLGTGIFFRATGGVVLNQNVAAGRVLTVNGTVNVRNSASGGTVNHTGAGTTIYNGTFAPSNVTVSAGEVQFNAAGGSTRHGTSTTVINGGKLVVNNATGSATGSGAVTVNNNGTLTGQGIMSGLVTVNSGGTLVPKENAVGSLNAGSLALASGSKMKWEAVDASQADLINVTTSDGLTINGGTVELFNAGTATPFTGVGTFNLISYSGAVNGTGVSSLAVAESSKILGQTYTFGLTAGFVTLRIEVGSRPQSFWNVNAAGNWSTAGNWTSNGVPNAISAIANLGGSQGVAITAPRTVTLTTGATVGVLNFDSAQSFTVAGSQTLGFDDGDAAASIHVINGSHTITAPVFIPPAGILASVENAASTLTLQSPINGDGGLGKSGPGTLILAEDNFYAGLTSNSAGLLQLGTGGATGSVSGPIANNGTLRVNRSEPFTFNYTISGAGGIEFVGSGTSTLNVANTFGGPTTLSAGTIQIGDPGALQNSTLTYSTTGGTVSYLEGLSSVVLGALAGDKSFPLSYDTISDPVTTLSVSLTVGQNNQSTTYAPSTTGIGNAFTKAGSGTFALGGTHVFSGPASVSGGILSLDTGAVFTAGSVGTAATAGAKVRLNGGTLNSSVLSVFTNASAGLEILTGTANFSGGITSENNPDNNAFFVNIAGGTLNTASMRMSRGNLNLGANEPTAGSTTAGLYLHGGTVDIATTLIIGNNATNSTATTRIDSGSLTVGGATTLAINNPDRWSVLDIPGGTFTSTDTVTGVRLGGSTVGRVVMLARGGVITAERFQFGQPDLAGTANLNLTAGSLYVGAGGMILGSANPAFNSRFRLGGGVLGATADSTSTVAMSLTGPAVVTGADAADVPHSVTFAGSVDGTGSLTKNGSGTVSFTSPNIAFTGAVTVNSGTLGLGGQTGAVTVAPATTLIPRSTLSAQAASTVEGTLAIRHDEANGLYPGRLHAQGVLTLGAASVLDIGGVGALGGGIYTLASASGGITGTFASVSGLPPGYTLVYSANSVTLLSNTASSFDLWANSFGLSGANADTNADPDNDGLKNLVEFALGSSPTLPGAAGGPVLGSSGDFLTLSFPHIADPKLIFSIEASDTLTGAWATIHTYPVFATSGTATYTDTVAISSTARRFLRLSVALAD